MPVRKEIESNDNDPLFNKSGMVKMIFPSKFFRIRYYTLLIMQAAPVEIQRKSLLEQQISEILKNAVKHGNHCDPEKDITVWYAFGNNSVHLIVEDEGDGFQELDRWNDFNRKRIECLQTHNYRELERYVSFRTKRSDTSDGGNALFAAEEFWNGGFVFNTKKTLSQC